MARVLMIDEAYIKSNTVIDDNVSAQALMIVAYDAQEMYIEPLLGTRLYNKLKSDITADTVAGDYLTLLGDYVVPTLLKWIIHDFVPINSQRIRNVGSTTKAGENSQSMSIAQIQFSMGLAEKKAELIGAKMVDYLVVNSSSFPEYTLSNLGGEIAAIRSATNTGIYLGQGRPSEGNYGSEYYEKYT